VEEAGDRWIGISCAWSEENLAAFLQMLIDEINQHTGYDLALQPWHQHGRVKSRNRIARKRSGIEDVVKQGAAARARTGQVARRWECSKHD